MKKRQSKPERQAIKQFVAWARVSSREQETEGFSLDVQEEALSRYAQREGGEIAKLFRVAETASKKEERKRFREMVAFAKANAHKLDGLLVYKFDRAARNLHDYLQLEKLETEHGLPFISTSQPIEADPTGWFLRRTLTNIATLQTDQQSKDVREGLAMRVESGLFVGLAPYGYRNVRINGRSVVELDEAQAENVRRVYALYARHRYTLDMIVEQMAKDGIPYRDVASKWHRAKVHTILRDRAYIGEVKYKGQWYPGTHPKIIDRLTWDRVNALLGEKIYHAHELTFAGNLIVCGHCGKPITGESVLKKQTGKRYVYYRCARYNAADHPPIRLREATLDEQVLTMLDRLKQSDADREWFARMLHLRSVSQQDQSRARSEDIQRQLTTLRTQQDRLLEAYTLGQIDGETLASKNTEYRDRMATLSLQLEAADRRRDEEADLTAKVFELSQGLTERWVSAEYAVKRQILELVCLNFTLEGATLVPEMRKPFDQLIEGLRVSSSRGDKI